MQFLNLIIHTQVALALRVNGIWLAFDIYSCCFFQIMLKTPDYLNKLLRKLL